MEQNCTSRTENSSRETRWECWTSSNTFFYTIIGLQTFTN